MGRAALPKSQTLWLLHACPCCSLRVALEESAAPAARSLLVPGVMGRCRLERGLSAASLRHLPSARRASASSLAFILINTCCTLRTPTASGPSPCPSCWACSRAGSLYCTGGCKSLGAAVEGCPLSPVLSPLSPVPSPLSPLPCPLSRVPCPLSPALLPLSIFVLYMSSLIFQLYSR